MENVLFTFLYSTSKTKHTVQQRQSTQYNEDKNLLRFFPKVCIIEFVHVITTERFADNNRFTHIEIVKSWVAEFDFLVFKKWTSIFFKWIIVQSTDITVQELCPFMFAHVH